MNAKASKVNTEYNEFKNSQNLCNSNQERAHSVARGALDSLVLSDNACKVVR
jgi:hypothetical protein